MAVPGRDAGAGPMMDLPLNAWLLFDHGPAHAPEAELVSRDPAGRVERGTYAESGRRAQQLMHGLDRLGLARNDVVASLAWNSARHLEAYFGVPCTGRVLHTLNARLPAEELAFIMQDAGDRAVLVDPDLLGLLEESLAHQPRPEHIIVLADSVPDSSIPGLIAYEDLLADESTTYPRLPIDEREPMGICYTSGTTGRPKAAVYTHRSTFLHALAVTSHAGMSIGPGDAVLPQVPMFHANAWGMPYAAAAVGAKQVFFAGPLEASGFVDLLAGERVTVAAGVPTVWLAIADELASTGRAAPRSPPHRLRGSPAPAFTDRALRGRIRDPCRPGLGDDRDVTAGLDGMAPGAHAGVDGRRDHHRGPDPGRAAPAGHRDQHPR